jgi:hypothetical protein
MADYVTGYKKPPKHSQFKPGNRANPHGRRGKKEPRTAAEIFNEVMNQVVEYREGGKAKRAPRIELLIKRYGAEAALLQTCSSYARNSKNFPMSPQSLYR